MAAQKSRKVVKQFCSGGFKNAKRTSLSLTPNSDSSYVDIVLSNFKFSFYIVLPMHVSVHHIHAAPMEGIEHKIP